MGNDRWKLNQLHLTVHFSKCQTVTALPLIEKLNRYKMILNNILERRNDFEKHFWKIGYGHQRKIQLQISEKVYDPANIALR